MRKAINYTGLFFLLACAACQHHYKPADYVHYIADPKNGYKRIMQVDGWEYDMQYKPYEYIMLMENKGNLKNYNPVQRKSGLAGTVWFNISIKRIDNRITPLRYGITSSEEYNQRLNYYLNEAVNDIRLLYGTDTLHPVSYLFENNYNLTPQETMVVGFYLPKDEHQPGRDMQLSFVDRIFKNGIINARYTKEILENIPGLDN